jgi:hypothetical protein
MQGSGFNGFFAHGQKASPPRHWSKATRCFRQGQIPQGARPLIGTMCNSSLFGTRNFSNERVPL